MYPTHTKKGLSKTKRGLFVFMLIVLALAVGSYIAFRSNQSPSLNLVPVRVGTIVQEVSVTGNTKPVDDLSLAFEKGGTIKSVYVSVGDTVRAGQVLVKLDTSELMAQLAQAQASAEAEQAKLNDLRQGSRPEDIAVSRTALQKAQQDLTNDYSGVVDVLADVYTEASDAVRNQISALFSNGETNPQLTFTAADSQAKYDSEAGRSQASAELNAWRGELLAVSAVSASSDLDAAIGKALSHLVIIKDFLNRVADVLSSTVGLPDATLAAYRTNVTTARTNVNTGISNVRGKQQEIAVQAITVKQLQDELNLKIAGATKEQINAQSALVRQAEASMQNIQAQIGKMTLISPISGIVTKQDAKVGQIATPNTPLVAIISSGKLQIEANIPETDIAKVKTGDTAKVTLDTFGNDVIFEAKIVSIDPAETIIEGVATYKTDFEFVGDTSHVKPGMTANIDILSDRRDNVLIIPQRAVTVKDGTSYVTVFLGNGLTEERAVTPGLRGVDGNVEVTSGLTEGDRLVIAH